MGAPKNLFFNALLLTSPYRSAAHWQHTPSKMGFAPTALPRSNQRAISNVSSASTIAWPRRVRAYDSEGEDEASADAKLWRGAHEEGWRVHAKGGAHYVYVSPTVQPKPRPCTWR